MSVSRDTYSGKWRASTQLDGQTIDLGLFSTAEEASAARERFASSMARILDASPDPQTKVDATAVELIVAGKLSWWDASEVDRVGAIIALHRQGVLASTIATRFHAPRLRVERFIREYEEWEARRAAWRAAS
ncbi:MAG TPA: hypothetical protein VGN22_15940 [Pseudonocardia sp.]